MSLDSYLNEKLSRRGRSLDGRPIWRLVWSSSQKEIRRGLFSDFYGKIFLREVEEVRTVPKYWYVRDRWILERLTFLPPNAAIHSEVLGTNTLDIFAPSKNGTYEPIYVFQDRDGQPLPLSEIVLETIMYSLEFGERVKVTDSDLQDEFEREIGSEAAYFENILEDAGRSPLFASENSVFIERVRPDDVLISSNTK